MVLLQKYQELLRVSQKLVNFIEEHNVNDDFDAEEGDTWRSSEFSDVITEAKTVISRHTEESEDDVSCLVCTGYNAELCTVRGIELHDHKICNAFEAESINH